MLLRLILLFTLIPFLELYLLLKIADKTSAQFTFALVVATGILGAILARRQGFQWRQKMAMQLQEGQLPTDGILDGLMIFVAGALLLTPGVLTDLVGFGLLITPLRAILKASIRNKISQSFQAGVKNQYTWTNETGGASSGRDRVIESYVIENRENPDSDTDPETPR